jgi:hypothetical protein
MSLLLANTNKFMTTFQSDYLISRKGSKKVVCHQRNGGQMLFPTSERHLTTSF